MSNTVLNPLALVGRILLALMFVLSGFGKLTHFAGTAGYIGSAGLPMPEVLAALTIILERSFSNSAAAWRWSSAFRHAGRRSVWVCSRYWSASSSTLSGPCRPSRRW
jgi:hypothetical protein